MTSAEQAQKEFDAKYVTSRELLQRLGVTRPTISRMRKRGLLPAPIVLNDTMVHIWIRAEVEEVVKAQELLFKAKRASQA